MEQKTRNQIPEELKWNIKSIYETEEEYEKDLDNLKQKTESFLDKYTNSLDTADIIAKSLKDLEEIMVLIDHTMHYSTLNASVDKTDSKNLKREGQFTVLCSDIESKLSFYQSALIEKDDSLLKEVDEKTEGRYHIFIRDILKSRKIYLGKEKEQLLKALSLVLEMPEQMYEITKHSDMHFDSFKANNKVMPLSFVDFENKYQIDGNEEVRKESFKEFSKGLSHYQNAIAAIYNSQVQKEKIISKQRGFDSVIDYLLYDQDVTREMYNRQIDLIESDLSPVMQKFMNYKKQVLKIDHMGFEDLKAPLFGELFENISVDDAYGIVVDTLSVLGDEYLDIAKRYKADRWVDFAQNKGKSTGGFCSSPYGKQPYILLTWTGLLSELYTLVHEIGHGVHFTLAQRENSIFNQEPSLYMVEAPSTCNEMLLTNYLLKKYPEKKKEILAAMIENTYYHNFVTHLLEASYQRKVYDLVDKGESMDAETLNKLKLESLRNFWKDSVDIQDQAALTWMRQPHYYCGLYSYTYSAGLTVSTSVALKLRNQEKGIKEKYIEFLKAGGRYTPVDLCKIVDVDITTDKPLRDTIKYISDSVDEIVK